ncbi:MAG: hypothetical protein AUI14_17915 [Actinobacteria bacterium 13_2_20CM_2_71_6]|nr:MAG: hypothetical protein AUI14_17915 [Actinobacteria bacterium 13_2_20CM_2_71_6]
MRHIVDHARTGDHTDEQRAVLLREALGLWRWEPLVSVAAPGQVSRIWPFGRHGASTGRAHRTDGADWTGRADGDRPPGRDRRGDRAPTGQGAPTGA